MDAHLRLIGYSEVHVVSDWAWLTSYHPLIDSSFLRCIIKRGSRYMMRLREGCPRYTNDKLEYQKIFEKEFMRLRYQNTLYPAA
jgi:hypothetical protein